jgi:hypothetical protein
MRFTETRANSVCINRSAVDYRKQEQYHYRSYKHVGIPLIQLKLKRRFFTFKGVSALVHHAVTQGFDEHLMVYLKSG